MRCWCDLSWMEKIHIEEGKVNSLDYLSDCSFDIKTKVQEGQDKKKEKEKNE